MYSKELIEKLAAAYKSIYSAPRHVRDAFFNNPALHKRLSRAGGKATAGAKKKKTAPVLKQTNFDDKLDAVPHEEGLKLFREGKQNLRKEAISRNIPNVRFLRGPRAGKNLARIVNTQPAVRFLNDYAKNNLSKKEYKKFINRGINASEDALGTIGTGRKGSRSYINYDLIKKDRKGGRGPSLRNVVTHEKWHAERPILGRSELLAHFVGGLNQDRGKLNIARALHDAFIHFPRTRKLRSIVEIGGGAGTVYGASKLLNSGEKKAAIVKLAKSKILQDLIEAKKLSDDRDFVHKNELLRKVLLEHPKQFKVDSHLNSAYVGLTHKPTGFKIHAQKKIIPSELLT